MLTECPYCKTKSKDHRIVNQEIEEGNMGSETDSQIIVTRLCNKCAETFVHVYEFNHIEDGMGEIL